MLDIRFVRENPEIVKENIKKKFQDAKLPLVDEVIALDAKRRAAIAEADQLRADRNRLSKQVGMLMGQAKRTPLSWRKPRLSRPKSRSKPTAWRSWSGRRRSWRNGSTISCW